MPPRRISHRVADSAPGAASTSAASCRAAGGGRERDPALRSTVVALLWLDRAPDWDVLAARIDRMSRVMTGLRQRIAEPLFPLTTPRWTYDAHFDLSWHLRRASAPPPTPGRW